MAHGTKNEATLLVEGLVDEMLALYNVLRERFKVPFMEEEVTVAEYKRRFMAMTEEQRQAEIQRVGPQGVLGLLGMTGETNGRV